MEKWFKFCQDKTTTISVSNSGSCDADSQKLVFDINIDTVPAMKDKHQLEERFPDKFI